MSAPHDRSRCRRCRGFTHFSPTSAATAALLAEAAAVPCRLEHPGRDPDWKEEALVDVGRRFFREHLLGVALSNFRSLVVGLFLPNLCDILAVTSRSETKAKAYNRYLETLSYLFRLYDSDSALNNTVVSVNAMHRHTARAIEGLGRAEIRKRAEETVAKESENNEQTVLDAALLRDLSAIRFECLPAISDPRLYSAYVSSPVAFSQLDMALVASAFYATIVTVPHAYGARTASDRDLLGLAHYWAVISHQMGVHDRFNVCAAQSLSSVRSATSALALDLVLPAVLRADPVSLHMANAVCGAYGANINIVLFAYFYDHGLFLESVWSAFSLSQKAFFWLRYFVLRWLQCVPVVRGWLNRAAIAYVNRLKARAEAKKHS